MDNLNLMYNSPGRPSFIAYGGPGKVQQYAVNDSNIFDIVPPSGTKITGSLCNKCAFFIKEGDCKKGELQKSAASVKLYRCKIFYDKQDVQQTK